MKNLDQLGVLEMDVQEMKIVNAGNNADLVSGVIGIAATSLGVGAAVVSGPLGWIAIACAVAGYGTSIYSLATA